MKRLFFTGAALIAITGFIACNKNDHKTNNSVINPCLPSNLSTGILAFYSFSSGSVNDFSGNNHDLANNTGAQPAADRNGNPNCAYEFNGSQFLTHVSPSFLNNLTQFSVSLWYMPLDTTRSAGDYEVLICRDTMGSCPDRYGQWSVSLYDCRKAVFAVQNSVWDANTPAGCDVAARTGSWHHLAATYDGQGNAMKIFRDGVLQESGPLTVSCGSSGIPAPMQNIGDLFLGRQYIGRLDDVIIYDHTLNQSEITQLSQMGTCCAVN